MTSYDISRELQAATIRQNLTQMDIARKTHRTKSTVNGYFNGQHAPIDAVAHIALCLDDSIFSQDMANKVFGTLPAMDSSTYELSVHSIDYIVIVEESERQQKKNQAMIALTKNKDTLTENDRDVILKYALDYLDEVFIETSSIISILDKLNISLRKAVNERTPHWKAKKYLRGER
ncbi:helix-turn-helix domain-containing protein [Alkalibacterium sp. f15]|uniref:helix-turn-helix domain-containing protein n=1 Tax=Alkalibacterium sp. f15 TaxID=3414029 RepID=UPI003BF90B40